MDHGEVSVWDLESLLLPLSVLGSEMDITNDDSRSNDGCVPSTCDQISFT